MASPRHDRPPRAVAPGVVTLLGGLLIAVAPFLPWAQATVPEIGTFSRSAVDEGNGWAFVAAGIVIAGLGVRTLAAGFRRDAQVVLVVVALAVLVAGAWVYADVSSQFGDIRDSVDEASSDVGGTGLDLPANDLLELEHGAGLYLVLAGGVLALAGAPRTYGRGK